MKLDVPPHIKLVSQDQVKSWRYEDREKYIDKVLMDILTANSEYGSTIEELKNATGFDRRTISTHLTNFVTRGEIYKELRGKRLATYRVNGQTVGKPEAIKSDPSKRHYFALYRLENNDGKYVYIQEREIDDFKRESVRGVIKISDEEMEDFIKKFHAFAVKVRVSE